MPIKRPIRRRRKPTTPRWWTGRRLTAYGKQAISVLVLVGTLFLREHQPMVPAKRDEEPPPDSWATNSRQLDEWYGFSGGEARAVPSKPFAGQQQPPCNQKQEREINGGCWVIFGDPAPCGRGYFEHQGKCYKPVPIVQRPPTSIEP